MKLKLKSYPEYKDSGAPWFGVIPSHWESLRLGSLLEERGKTNEAGEVQQVLSVLRDVGVIPYEEKGHIGNKRSEDITRYKLVRPNDLVINCMNVIIGSVGLSQYTGCLSPVYYVLKLRTTADHPYYFENIFKVKSFQQSLIRIGNGILSHRMRIPMEKLKCELVPRPPLPEQEIIVKFLKSFNTHLNGLIGAKQRLIKVLNEQKQAIVHRAVTRGLDPNVRLKPSGVDWVGEVPEHWEVMQLNRFLLGVEQGWSPVAAEGDVSEDQWAVVTLSSVKKGCFYSDENKPLARLSEIPAGLEIHKGDFLLTRSNTRTLVGDVCVVDHTRSRLILCDLIYRLRLDEKSMYSKFLMYQLLSPLGRSQIEADARGSSQTMVKISHGHIKKWSIAKPSLKEQIQIAEHLDELSNENRRMIGRILAEIELLREYRTRLVADVVTGKLDVVSNIELPAVDWDEELEAAALDETEEPAYADD